MLLAAIQVMAIGEREQALAALERCVEERGDHTPFYAVFPPFLTLRGEPRYERLLGTLGLQKVASAAA